MSYTLLKFEETTDRQGNPEAFVQVLFADAATGASIPHAQWLSGLAYADYLADNTVLPALIAPWEAEAKARFYDASVITPRQARLALLDAGLLDAVEAYVATQPRAVQLEWEYASEIRRDNALLSTAATALGMTSEQLQALFTQAATL